MGKADYWLISWGISVESNRPEAVLYIAKKHFNSYFCTEPLNEIRLEIVTYIIKSYIVIMSNNLRFKAEVFTNHIHCTIVRQTIVSHTKNCFMICFSHKYFVLLTV